MTAGAKPLSLLRDTGHSFLEEGMISPTIAMLDRLRVATAGALDNLQHDPLEVDPRMIGLASVQTRQDVAALLAAQLDLVAQLVNISRGVWAVFAAILILAALRFV
jgi:hypothetical protein